MNKWLLLFLCLWAFSTVAMVTWGVVSAICK